MATLDAKALSLVDYAKFSNDPQIQKVTYSLLKHNAILTDIPFFPRKSLSINGTRWIDNLPESHWVKINDTPATVTGAPVQYQEQSYLMRDYIRTDKALLNDQNQITDPHNSRVQAYLRSRSYDFNDTFINNNHASGNPDAIVGLRGRLDDPGKYGIRSDNKLNGAATLTQAATADNYIAFQEKLDELLYLVESPDGAGVVIYASDKFIRRFNALSRKFSGAGGFSTATDQLGRSVTMYKNAVIKSPGKKADQKTQVITDTEANTGANGSSTYTSIYAVKYGEEDFSGWLFDMNASTKMLDDEIHKQTFLELHLGLYPQTNYCFARMYGINLG